MTPQQLKAMKLALEALDIAQGMLADLRSQHQPKMLSAYTALEEVLAEHSMLEVQRLGQEIEQKIGCVNHDCDQCKAQPEQEPVATVTSETGADITMSWWHEPALPIGTKLYATPPQRTEQEPVAKYSDIVSDGGLDPRNKFDIPPQRTEQEPTLQKQLDKALRSLDFYRRRIEALQKWQSKMRDPERVIVCDIIANGCTLELAGDRYTTPPQRTWVGLTEQDLDYLCNLAYTGDEEFALAVQAKLKEKNA